MYKESNNYFSIPDWLYNLITNHKYYPSYIQKYDYTYLEKIEAYIESKYIDESPINKVWNSPELREWVNERVRLDHIKTVRNVIPDNYQNASNIINLYDNKTTGSETAVGLGLLGLG